MDDIAQSLMLLLVLLNPFLVVIYLIDVVEKLDAAQFRRVLLRAGLIAAGVFCAFALIGDAVFSQVVNAEFASFQIFGGVVFLLIGLQFVFRGPHAIEMLRGDAQHLAGAIAMPVLIGPGTISASVLIGKRHSALNACLVVAVSVLVCVVLLIALKHLHDRVRPRSEALVQRYIEVAGRITALVVGTVSIDMIMRGVESWAAKF